MLKNYLTTALRKLWRERASTFINLLGLALGICSSLLLFLLVRYHLNFDSFHARRDQIYRVATQYGGNNMTKHTPGVPSVFPDAFKADFPEAEEVTFISYRASALITIPQPGDQSRKFMEEKGVTFAQPSFFKIFDRQILLGNPQIALTSPNEAIIGKKYAVKYFGKEDARGEVLKFDDKEYKVTAIMEDAPSNSDFPFEVMLSYVTVQKEREADGWGSIWSDEQCYFLLRPNISIADVEKRLGVFYEKFDKENVGHRRFVVQPLAEFHFDDRFGNFNYNTVSKGTLLALSMVGLFLVITACVNFVNLTTAESIRRSKEVGIRKSLGSTRYQLLRQFLGETTVITLFSVVIALVGAWIALAFINPFLELDLKLDFLHDFGLWGFIIGAVICVSLLSGLYPSVVVSGFPVTRALKNQISAKNSSGYYLRRGLVVVQFFISQVFIIGTIVLVRQMDFFQNKELGFQRDAIITIPIPEEEEPHRDGASGKMRTLRNELAGLTGVEHVSLSSTPPSSGNTSNTGFTIEGDEQHYKTQLKNIDGNYLQLYDLKLVAGNNILDLDTPRGVLVNERLAATVGMKPETIVGKQIALNDRKIAVVGVVKDFHTMSLREPIEATILLNGIRRYQTASIQLGSGDKQPIIEQIQKKWEATYPDFVFSYQFLDEQIKEFYEQESKWSVLLSVFTSLAIFIGCLGLLGLATFMANQKSKEIGVRKVLGASVESIVLLFSKEYIMLIVLGFILAAPVAWYVMSEWLSNFAYKVDMSIDAYAMGISITLAVALGTVGYRSMKAAMVNPAQSLKSE
jgi:predicted permease